MGSCWITLIVLFQFGDELQTTQLQFGFKAKSSTNLGLCTFVLKEALSYYATNQSNVFCTFSDATKAFDRIDYCKLFRLLLKRDLPACILRVLLCFYCRSQACTWVLSSNSNLGILVHRIDLLSICAYRHCRITVKRHVTTAQRPATHTHWKYVTY